MQFTTAGLCRSHHGSKPGNPAYPHSQRTFLKVGARIDVLIVWRQIVEQFGCHMDACRRQAEGISAVHLVLFVEDYETQVLESATSKTRSQVVIA
jgi:hypothetical protein